jgi:hypothetical protein
MSAIGAIPENICSTSPRICRSARYLNVAKWDSWEAFAQQFAAQLASGSFNPEIETAPRQRAVLEVISDTAGN